MLVLMSTLSAFQHDTLLLCPVLFWNSLQQLNNVDAINDISSSSFSVVHHFSRPLGEHSARIWHFELLERYSRTRDNLFSI